MKIEHIAIWTNDLEHMRSFYTQYFNGTSNPQYHNKSKEFKSYFITFDDGTRLELMQKPTIPSSQNDPIVEAIGLAHFAMSVGSQQEVDRLTEQLRRDGYTVVGEPRTTGDGYYESIILDPEYNRIEITI